MQTAAITILPRTRSVLQAIRRLKRQRLRGFVAPLQPAVVTDVETATKYGFASVEAWKAAVLEDKRAEVRDMLLDDAVDDLLRHSRPREGKYALGGHE